jgi:methylated-DNA-protein-cysteine methyltransferase-like protein
MAASAGRARVQSEPGSLAERVLACVDLIPSGKVLSYGDVAEFVGTRAARNVGRIMAAEGGSVNWHRVLRSDGSCAPGIRAEQLRRLRAENVPMRGDRIDMAAARWSGH